MTTLEFRVTYRREGGKKTYRVFAKRKTTEKFLARLATIRQPGSPPVVEAYVDVRPCGPWLPVDDENLSYPPGKIIERTEG